MKSHRGRAAAVVLLLGLMACDSSTDAGTQARARTQRSFEAPGGFESDSSESAVILEPDGLGVVEFGSEPKAVIEQLAQRFGPPDEDSGWIPSFSDFGTCPGQHVRGMRWQSLLVLFTDGDTDFGLAGTRHFFGYTDHLFDVRARPTKSLGLTTADDIALASTVEDLRVAYDARLTINKHSLPGRVTRFVVDVDTGWLGGTLTGPKRTDTVQAIQGGFRCAE